MVIHGRLTDSYRVEMRSDGGTVVAFWPCPNYKEALIRYTVEKTRRTNGDYCQIRFGASDRLVLDSRTLVQK